MDVLNLSPYVIVDNFIGLIERLWNMGFDAFDRVFEYFLLGAVIVIPIWLISRLLGGGRRRDS